MKEKDFQYFTNCLIKAIKNIDAHYFQLIVAGNEEPIYRERVYCYELYHQLRCMLRDGFPYKLNGEVDKNGHPLIRNAKKPDFLIHQPGDMEHNLVVIEVKPVTVKDRISELREDIKTIKWFLNNANYYRAIMLIYGNVNGSLPENIKTEIENISDGRMLILWGSAPYIKPEIIRGVGYVV
jgi:hypothetical protein